MRFEVTSIQVAGKKADGSSVFSMNLVQQALTPPSEPVVVPQVGITIAIDDPQEFEVGQLYDMTLAPYTPA